MEKYRVKPGQRIHLKDWDPNETDLLDGDKDEGKERLEALNRDLERLQELLYAEHKHKVLIVLQGMDTSGKDGVIRHVFEGVNPQGVRVANFKVPTPEELDHDYLWRIHRQTPGKGEMVIFNRSHYEDVLVVRVHGLVPAEVWQRRYAHINAFEQMLAEEGTLILKFFLHIDLDEQKKRLQARLDDPTKRWKFNPGDLQERALWAEYMRAYEDVLSKTSTDYAPWYIVPSNKKWYRNYVVASVLVEALKGLHMQYPQPKDDLSRVVIP
ncbi:polyphosphate kinase [Thermanaerothrix daxensis]|uniref:Polyphosphate kinase n=1 Tax=Thermanaerothrix daxensis TaxID=869279 RepID=A0A0P6XFS2_9CHLR|nr:polyphosphate kinase 2 family protein [Thermanaerothrix daxensis]KPL82099.1 polyphosphate kinase [Thermanaerothrix daxensis]